MSVIFGGKIKGKKTLTCSKNLSEFNSTLLRGQACNGEAQFVGNTSSSPDGVSGMRKEKFTDDFLDMVSALIWPNLAL